MITDGRTTPLGVTIADFLAVPVRLVPSGLPESARQPLWDGTDYTGLAEPQSAFGRGHWLLAARPNIDGRHVGLTPLLQFTTSGGWDLTYEVYQDSLDALLVP